MSLVKKVLVFQAERTVWIGAERRPAWLKGKGNVGGVAVKCAGAQL